MPMLGIEMSPVPSPVLTREGLSPDQGVYVQNTFNNTAAQSMGIQPGDVVLGVNGTPIASMSDLRNEIGSNQVGDPVQVTVQRNGQQMSLSAPLQAWPSEIPHERIDPDAEQRFRDWQAQHQKQQQDEADQLKDQIGNLEQQLPPVNAASQARLQALEDALAEAGGLRPWRIAYHLVQTPPRPVQPTPMETAAPLAGAPALRLVWSSESAARTPASDTPAGAAR